jgi:hypothetical protein
MTFSAAHILITAAVTGLAAAGAAWWRLGRTAWPAIMAVFLVAGGSVFAWRMAASWPAWSSTSSPSDQATLPRLSDPTRRQVMSYSRMTAAGVAALGRIGFSCKPIQRHWLWTHRCS